MDFDRLQEEIFSRPYIPRSKGRKAARRMLSQEKVASLFTAYFNNKMTLLLLMLQKKRAQPDTLSSMRAVIFLDDLYRHMLRPSQQAQYARIFQWLMLFYRRYPHVKPAQTQRAGEYLRLLYKLFGFEIKMDI